MNGGFPFEELLHGSFDRCHVTYPIRNHPSTGSECLRK